MLLLLQRWHATAARLLPRRLHATAAMAKCLGPVGQRQQAVINENVHFTLQSTAEGRRAALKMVTVMAMAVFCVEHYGDDDVAAEE